MDMQCRCGRYGIYWKDLHTGNPYTYCPHCKNVNCHKIEIEDDENKEG